MAVAALPLAAETAPAWVPPLMAAVAAVAAAIGLNGLAEWAKAHSTVTEQTQESQPTACQSCPYANSGGGPNVMMNESSGENADSSGGPATADVPKYGDLPANPDELLDRGWKETTPQGMADNTDSREFTNPDTGEVVRWDKGKEGAPGWEGKDHYHVENPGQTGKGDRYLDINGKPVPKGSGPSHIPPNGSGS